MAARVMKTYKLVWSPTGQTIATSVVASTRKAAIRKAPKPYSRYKGEIYAEEIGTAQNPSKPLRAKLPAGKRLTGAQINWVKQNKNGTVTVSVRGGVRPIARKRGRRK